MRISGMRSWWRRAVGVGVSVAVVITACTASAPSLIESGVGTWSCAWPAGVDQAHAPMTAIVRADHSFTLWQKVRDGRAFTFSGSWSLADGTLTVTIRRDEAYGPLRMIIPDVSLDATRITPRVASISAGSAEESNAIGVKVHRAGYRRFTLQEDAPGTDVVTCSKQ